MGQPAFVIYPRVQQTSLQLIRGGAGRMRVKSNYRLTLWFALLLAAAQIADAYLTYTGLSLHGHAAEGNPIIKYLCALIGIGAGVALAKLFSLSCITVICRFGKRFAWMPWVLCALLIVHIAAAIVPWTFLLFS